MQQTRVPDACNYGINSFSAVYFFCQQTHQISTKLHFMHLFFGGKRNLSRLCQVQIHWHVLITKTNHGISVLYTAPHTAQCNQCLLLLGSLTFFLNFANRILFRTELIQVLDLFPTSSETMGKYPSIKYVRLRGEFQWLRKVRFIMNYRDLFYVNIPILEAG